MFKELSFRGGGVVQSTPEKFLNTWKDGLGLMDQDVGLRNRLSQYLGVTFQTIPNSLTDVYHTTQQLNLRTARQNQNGAELGGAPHQACGYRERCSSPTILRDISRRAAINPKPQPPVPTLQHISLGKYLIKLVVGDFEPLEDAGAQASPEPRALRLAQQPCETFSSSTAHLA